MSGNVLLAKDAVEPNGTLESPVIGLESVYKNQVITVSYRDPKYATDFWFQAKKLPNAKEPPRVLKPSDFNQGGSNRPYRPVIGFNPNMPKASLDISGHRALQ